MIWGRVDVASKPVDLLCPDDTLDKDPVEAEETRVYAIASGKGGVGKSVLATLIASGFERQGKRVLLVDGSPLDGNLHLLLGVQTPAHPDSNVLGADESSRIPVEVRPKLSLLPAGGGERLLERLSPKERARDRLRQTSLFDRYDIVIIDTGSGIEGALDATIRCDRVLVIAVPEPASLSDAYALIKILTMQGPSVPVDLLVNRASSVEEVDRVYALMKYACRRFLNRTIKLRGSFFDRPELDRATRLSGGMLSLADGEVDSIISSLNAACGDSKRER